MGRPRATSRPELERLAFELFAARGFDETTVDDIAAAAGIGRRTFFRYVPSKNDLVWGDFEKQLAGLRRLLAEADPAEPLMAVLHRAVLELNRFDPRTTAEYRRRMQLILAAPTLRADATLRYEAWRAVVAEFTSHRTGHPRDALLPRLVANVLLSAALTSYEQWLSHEEGPTLEELLDTALTHAATGLARALADETSTRTRGEPRGAADEEPS